MPMDVPTFKINNDDLQNLLPFIWKHESILKEFGGIKIQLNIDCKLALKKRRKHLTLSPNMEHIVKIRDNEPLYSVQKFDQIDESIEEHSLVIDESSFWSSLSCLSNKRRQVNTSLSPNTSFFASKTSRLYFGLQRLSSQSLLNIGGTIVKRQFVPWVKRAHGPGGIFPLTCTKQRLFSVDYHHEGGIHHWYVIPNYERGNLERLIKQKNSSICLDHGQLLIEPSVLDKNHIRYHRIIQRPNEFVVLSAGTLAQSFSLDASWSESISFALPSWIADGHADALLPSCQCNIHHEFLPELIDVTLFKNDLVQRYIESHLNINNDHNSTDSDRICMDTISTSNYIQNHSPNDEELMTSAQTTTSCFQSSSVPIITSADTCFFSYENKNTSDSNQVEVIYDVLEEGTFGDRLDANLFDFMASEYLLEPNSRTSQLHPTTNSSEHVHQDNTYNLNMDNHFFSYEELLNFFSFTENNIVPISGQANEINERNGSSIISSNKHITAVNKQNHVAEKRSLYQTTDNNKTLFVSGLKSNVNKNDIQNYFSGFEKVTIKQCRGTSDLKYAFVLHRTSQDAERNLQRPIDYYLLGPECHIDYANAGLAVCSNHYSFDKRKLVVSRISANVSENDLHCLFANARILKYRPARSTQLSTMAPGTNKKKNKILTGYAVLLYDNEQDAANVIEHANQYQINGQPLVISFYRNEKPSYATTRDLFAK